LPVGSDDLDGTAACVCPADVAQLEHLPTT
jgi:hypothetical protein